MYIIRCFYYLIYYTTLGCSNTSYKTGISNDDCTECPMNTVSSDMKRTSCVCKNGYYKTSSDKSEVSPCYGKLADLLLFSSFLRLLIARVYQ
jgi:hypothetical protein